MWTFLMPSFPSNTSIWIAYTSLNHSDAWNWSPLFSICSITNFYSLLFAAVLAPCKSWWWRERAPGLMILPLIFFFFFSSSIIQNTLSLLPLAVSSWYTTLFFHFYCISPLYASSMLPMPYCRCSVSGYFVSLHFDSPNLERRVLYRTIPGDLMMDASMGFWNVHNRRPSKLITIASL